MSELQRILFIDDECETLREELSESFGTTIDVIYCPTQDSAINELKSGKHFDLIILDWYLEDDNSNLSRLVLEFLYDRLFVPIFIWSHHMEDLNRSLESNEIKYPKMLIKPISKHEFSPESIKDMIGIWLESSPTAQISDIYRNSIRDNLEKVFFELSELRSGDLASILKVLVGDEENIDWSNDFILNLVHRKLLADDTFTANLKTLINAASNNLGNEELAKRRKIINKVLYYQSAPSIIRCGDIIKIQKDSEVLKYGIIVTPDCDIEQKRTKYLEIVELKRIEDAELRLTSGQKENIAQYNHDSFYYFPSISIDGDIRDDFVAVLKAKLIIDALFDINDKRYPEVPQKLIYSGRYLYQGQEVQLVHICSKSNPYKSDFLQKLYANNSRVGTPDIKNLLKP